MSTQTKKHKHRELSPEDMTMHDIVWMFLATGLLSSGQFDTGASVIKYSMELADEFFELRSKETAE